MLISSSLNTLQAAIWHVTVSFKFLIIEKQRGEKEGRKGEKKGVSDQKKIVYMKKN